MNPTGMHASRAAASRSDPSSGAESITGRGVRHRDHRAKAARGGSARAALQVLLVLLAGTAQVHVRVEEGGRQQPSRSVDQLDLLERLAERAGLGQRRDLAVAHQHVAAGVESRARLEHAHIPQQQLGRRVPSMRERLGGHHVN